MVDENEENEEHDHFKRMMAQAEVRMKKQFDSMMGSMMDAMAPMLMGTQFMGDEAKAWDQYYCAYLSTMRAKEGESLPDNAEQFAIDSANRMLSMRRKLFNKELMDEQLRGMLPSGRGLCNEPILRDNGEDTGMRCTRNAGHEGNVHY